MIGSATEWKRWRLRADACLASHSRRDVPLSFFISQAAEAEHQLSQAADRFQEDAGTCSGRFVSGQKDQMVMLL